ncbi:hypothetical protein DUNSADRAFT_7129, partial [Dunaliella salina]
IVLGVAHVFPRCPPTSAHIAPFTQAPPPVRFPSPSPGAGSAARRLNWQEPPYGPEQHQHQHHQHFQQHTHTHAHRATTTGSAPVIHSRFAAEQYHGRAPEGGPPLGQPSGAACASPTRSSGSSSSSASQVSGASLRQLLPQGRKAGSHGSSSSSSGGSSGASSVSTERSLQSGQEGDSGALQHVSHNSNHRQHGALQHQKLQGSSNQLHPSSQHHSVSLQPRPPPPNVRHHHYHHPQQQGVPAAQHATQGQTFPSHCSLPQPLHHSHDTPPLPQQQEQQQHAPTSKMRVLPPDGLLSPASSSADTYGVAAAVGSELSYSSTSSSGSSGSAVGSGAGAQQQQQQPHNSNNIQGNLAHDNASRATAAAGRASDGSEAQGPPRQQQQQQQQQQQRQQQHLNSSSFTQAGRGVSDARSRSISGSYGRGDTSISSSSGGYADLASRMAAGRARRAQRNASARQGSPAEGGSVVSPAVAVAGGAVIVGSESLAQPGDGSRVENHADGRHHHRQHQPEYQQQQQQGTFGSAAAEMPPMHKLTVDTEGWQQQQQQRQAGVHSIAHPRSSRVRTARQSAQGCAAGDAGRGVDERREQEEEEENEGALADQGRVRKRHRVSELSDRHAPLGLEGGLGVFGRAATSTEKGTHSRLPSRGGGGSGSGSGSYVGWAPTLPPVSHALDPCPSSPSPCSSSSPPTGTPSPEDAPASQDGLHECASLLPSHSSSEESREQQPQHQQQQRHHHHHHQQQQQQQQQRQLGPPQVMGTIKEAGLGQECGRCSEEGGERSRQDLGISMESGLNKGCKSSGGGSSGSGGPSIGFGGRSRSEEEDVCDHEQQQMPLNALAQPRTSLRPPVEPPPRRATLQQELPLQAQHAQQPQQEQPQPQQQQSEQEEGKDQQMLLSLALKQQQQQQQQQHTQEGRRPGTPTSHPDANLLSLVAQLRQQHAQRVLSGGGVSAPVQPEAPPPQSILQPAPVRAPPPAARQQQQLRQQQQHLPLELLQQHQQQQQDQQAPSPPRGHLSRFQADDSVLFGSPIRRPESATAASTASTPTFDATASPLGAAPASTAVADTAGRASTAVAPTPTAAATTAGASTTVANAPTAAADAAGGSTAVANTPTAVTNTAGAASAAAEAHPSAPLAGAPANMTTASATSFPTAAIAVTSPTAAIAPPAGTADTAAPVATATATLPTGMVPPFVGLHDRTSAENGSRAGATLPSGPSPPSLGLHVRTSAENGNHQAGAAYQPEPRVVLYEPSRYQDEEAEEEDEPSVVGQQQPSGAPASDSSGGEGMRMSLTLRPGQLAGLVAASKGEGSPAALRTSGEPFLAHQPTPASPPPPSPTRAQPQRAHNHQHQQHQQQSPAPVLAHFSLTDAVPETAAATSPPPRLPKPTTWRAGERPLPSPQHQHTLGSHALPFSPSQPPPSDASKHATHPSSSQPHNPQRASAASTPYASPYAAPSDVSIPGTHDHIPATPYAACSDMSVPMTPMPDASRLLSPSPPTHRARSSSPLGHSFRHAEGQTEGEQAAERGGHLGIQRGQLAASRRHEEGVAGSGLPSSTRARHSAEAPSASITGHPIFSVASSDAADAAGADAAGASAVDGGNSRLGSVMQAQQMAATGGSDAADAAGGDAGAADGGHSRVSTSAAAVAAAAAAAADAAGEAGAFGGRGRSLPQHSTLHAPHPQTAPSSLQLPYHHDSLRGVSPTAREAALSSRTALQGGSTSPTASHDSRRSSKLFQLKERRQHQHGWEVWRHRSHSPGHSSLSPSASPLPSPPHQAHQHSQYTHTEQAPAPPFHPPQPKDSSAPRSKPTNQQGPQVHPSPITSLAPLHPGTPTAATSHTAPLDAAAPFPLSKQAEPGRGTTAAAAPPHLPHDLDLGHGPLGLSSSYTTPGRRGDGDGAGAGAVTGGTDSAGKAWLPRVGAFIDSPQGSPSWGPPTSAAAGAGATAAGQAHSSPTLGAAGGGSERAAGHSPTNAAASAEATTARPAHGSPTLGAAGGDPGATAAGQAHSSPALGAAGGGPGAAGQASSIPHMPPASHGTETCTPGPHYAEAVAPASDHAEAVAAHVAARGLTPADTLQHSQTPQTLHFQVPRQQGPAPVLSPSGSPAIQAAEVWPAPLLYPTGSPAAQTAETAAAPGAAAAAAAATADQPGASAWGSCHGLSLPSPTANRSLSESGESTHVRTHPSTVGSPYSASAVHQTFGLPISPNPNSPATPISPHLTASSTSSHAASGTPAAASFNPEPFGLAASSPSFSIKRLNAPTTTITESRPGGGGSGGGASNISISPPIMLGRGSVDRLPGGYSNRANDINNSSSSGGGSSPSAGQAPRQQQQQQQQQQQGFRTRHGEQHSYDGDMRQPDRSMPFGGPHSHSFSHSPEGRPSMGSAGAGWASGAQYPLQQQQEQEQEQQRRQQLQAVKRSAALLRLKQQCIQRHPPIAAAAAAACAGGVGAPHGGDRSSGSTSQCRSIGDGEAGVTEEEAGSYSLRRGGKAAEGDTTGTPPLPSQGA